MLFRRVIPALLIDGRRLVKGRGFKNHRYVGDPMNAIRIFSAKMVDELMLLDISATARGTTIDPAFVEKVSSECLMPLTVGGGIRSVDVARTLLGAGAEKVLLGTAALETPQIIEGIAAHFGNQSIVVSVDVSRDGAGKPRLVVRSGTKRVAVDPVAFAREVVSRGAGEILVNSVDRDGEMTGFDVPLVREIADAVDVPVIALGGAGDVDHFADVISRGGASAVAAGSAFVFHGPRRAVLVKFPRREDIERLSRLGSAATTIRREAPIASSFRSPELAT